jgi:pimeloyl-ACP methyl ester carboxylesterase
MSEKAAARLRRVDFSQVLALPTRAPGDIMAEYSTGTSSCQRAVVDLMGGTPTKVPERYQIASPVLLTLLPNTVLVQGADDTIVSPTHALSAASRAGIKLLPVANAGHFDLVHPDSIAWPLILQALDKAFADPVP